MSIKINDDLMRLEVDGKLIATTRRRDDPLAVALREELR
jgi:hypothetical protein